MRARLCAKLLPCLYTRLLMDLSECRQMNQQHASIYAYLHFYREECRNICIDLIHAYAICMCRSLCIQLHESCLALIHNDTYLYTAYAYTETHGLSPAFAHICLGCQRQSARSLREVEESAEASRRAGQHHRAIGPSVRVADVEVPALWDKPA